MRRSVLLIIVILALVPLVGMAQERHDTVEWYDRVHELQGITIDKKREAYSRNGNPAVELMKKVIGHKRMTDPTKKSYCKYDTYQKLTLALNDVTPQQLTEGALSKIPGIINHIEACEQNNKLIMPVTVSETVKRSLFSGQPSRSQVVTLGERSEGIDQLFQTGDEMVRMLRDFFTDVNLYEDNVRLLKQNFLSPIASGAIAFYRFHIVDTVRVGLDRCIHLAFGPENQRDMGFSGELYVMADTTYQLRRAVLTIPKQSIVNHIDNIKIWQEFEALPSGEMVLASDDMMIEMSLADVFAKTVILRTTRHSDYSFEAIPAAYFSPRLKQKEERKAKERDITFWNEYRRTRLTFSEQRMGLFVDNLWQSSPALRTIGTAVKVLVDNYIPTGKPSRFDFGPVSSGISGNSVDGLRLRIGGRTTNALSRHIQLEGYYAHGFRSRADYWSATVRSHGFSFTAAKDIRYPSDPLMPTDKDNLFAAWKWGDDSKMMAYRRQELAYEHTIPSGLTLSAAIKRETYEGRGSLEFERIKTTELRFALAYKGWTLSHHTGISGFLGGEWRYNTTEMRWRRKTSLNTWGTLDSDIRGGVEWDSKPWVLQFMPAANISYFAQPLTFALIDNMEMMSDRYASAIFDWDINGRLFNRIPMVNRLKLREYLSLRTWWGHGKPYVEAAVGIHNILSFMHVEYVRRLNYTNALPSVHKQGVRIRAEFKF
ncbi:MAG: DUF5686 family protein [Prevotella sp.]